jgi:hypothetical protein
MILMMKGEGEVMMMMRKKERERDQVEWKDEVDEWMGWDTALTVQGRRTLTARGGGRNRTPTQNSNIPNHPLLLLPHCRSLSLSLSKSQQSCKVSRACIHQPVKQLSTTFQDVEQ